MCGENKCELCKAGKVGIGVARLARARLNVQPGAVWSRARSERVVGWMTDELLRLEKGSGDVDRIFFVIENLCGSFFGHFSPFSERSCLYLP